MRKLLTRDRLLSLVAAPTIWAAHLLACYVLVSLACAYEFGGTEAGIAILTLAALLLLGYTGFVNYRKWMEARHSKAPDADISIFFSLNAMLLCGMSAIALVWVAFPAALLPSCAA